MRNNLAGRIKDRITNPVVLEALCLTIGLLVFVLILSNRSPNLLRPISLSIHSGFTLVVPVAAFVIYLAFRQQGWLGVILGLTSTLALFAFALAGLWISGDSQSTLLGGLIPLSDANAYYMDSLRLLASQDFSSFSARRPIFPGFLSFLLFLAGRNLMTTLAVLNAITALSCYFAAREIWKKHGSGVAVFVLMILFLFYRTHSGVTMSEHLGVALGALGLGLLYSGSSSHRLLPIWLGLLITTLALNARAGAFFILPLVLIWVGFIFKGDSTKYSWRAFLLGCSAVLAGFFLNLVLVRLLADSSGVPFANFAYTLYGVAAGGKSWTNIFQAHPELQSLPEPESIRQIYLLAFELILHKPWLFVQGALYSWKMLFSVNSWYNAYAYVGGGNWTITLIARLGLFLLSFLGIIQLMRKLTDPTYSLIAVSVLGLLLSVPFLPPTDAHGMRPYAASIGLFGLLPAFGLEMLLERLRKNDERTSDEALLPFSFINVYTGLIVLFLIVGPLLLKTVKGSPGFINEKRTCTKNIDRIAIRFDPGTFLNVMERNILKLDWMPDFHIGLFRASAHSLADSYLINWTASLEPGGYSLFYTLDFLSSREVFVVTPMEGLPLPGTYLYGCGFWDPDPDLMHYRIFHASNFEQIQVLDGSN